MATSFDVELVTPERILFQGPAEQVILRTREGDLAFLAGHAPLIGSVEPCIVRIQYDDAAREQRAAVHGGFVRTSHNRTVILAAVAELAEEIDLDRARRAKEKSAQALSTMSASAAQRLTITQPNGEEADVTAEAMEAAQRRAELRIETAETPHF
ncbi:MAG: ATP synthase F1 subunit epsilon [Actinomycetota bacterium]|nr:ATP synthase F1 subunit epsilon [Actinomycetota bacterium]